MILLEFWSTISYAKVKKLEGAERLEPVLIMQRSLKARSLLPVSTPALVSCGGILCGAGKLGLLVESA